LYKRETGCGKTTQVPQYLVESQLLKTALPFGQIICTQPRRISATSVATRLQVPITHLMFKGFVQSWGTMAQVLQIHCVDIRYYSGFHGYQCKKIRLESRVSRESTMLLYCTTGILIRKLRGDPLLKDIKYIIIDEVHERTIESDFLLVIAKDLLMKRPDIRLIFMRFLKNCVNKILKFSATMEAEKLSKFFGGCPVISVPGRTFPVREFFLEDAIQDLGYTIEEGAEYARHYFSTKDTRTTQAINVTGRGTNSQLLYVIL
jgi:ATP-dependent RNA helicase DHX29